MAMVEAATLRANIALEATMSTGRITRTTRLALGTCALLMGGTSGCMDSEPLDHVDTLQEPASSPPESFQTRAIAASGTAVYRDGCRFLDIEFGGIDQTIHYAGSDPEVRNFTIAHVFGRDTCLGVIIEGGEPVAGTYDGDLNHASASAAFDAIYYAWPGGSPDQPLGTLAVTIDGELTGVGEITRESNHVLSGQCPACTEYREQTETRAATVQVAFTLEGESLEATPQSGVLYGFAYSYVTPGGP
jgi:hypothetical protein